MEHIKRLLVVLCLVLLAAPARAQTDGPLRIVSVDQSQLPTLKVTVSYQALAPGSPTAPPFAVQVNGSAVDSASVKQKAARLPVAVALVADLSAPMSDRGTSGQTRHADMAALIKNLVSQIQSVDTRGSLVVFGQSATLAHALTNDMVAIQNTLINANPNLLFNPADLGSATPDTPYALPEALDMALKELDKAPPEQPRTLVVFAVGAPQQQLDTPAIRQAFEQARADRRPINLLVFGFGSGEQGAFETFAANPDGLQQFAKALGGQFVAVAGQPLDEAAKRDIDGQFGAILARGEHYELTFEVGSLPSGPGSVRVVADGGADEIKVDFSASLPPRFDVVTDSRNFQDKVRLAISPTFQQAPIAKVSYFLNNRPIDAEVTQGPDFALTVDVYSASFQERFPPGQYELSAAATDQAGRENRSEQPIPIKVFAPPERGPLDSLTPYWWVLLVVPVVIGGVVLLQRRSARPQPAYPGGMSGYQNDDNNPTLPYSGGSRPQPAEDDKTQHFDPDDTQRINGQTTPSVRWQVDIFRDGGWHPIEMPPDGRHYILGRPTQTKRPDVSVENPNVSREHAKLEVFRDMIELVAFESENGTFVGENRQRLAPKERRTLQSGDVFWLSPEVKLRVRSETEKP